LQSDTDAVPLKEGREAGAEKAVATAAERFNAQSYNYSDRYSTMCAFAGLFVVLLTTREWAVLGSNR
jgi:hypothetical protein